MSQKIPAVKPKKLISILQKAGFEKRRQKGSHLILFNRETKRRIVVPIHNKDLKIGTLRAIINQAGLSEEEIFYP